jgi:hypothetical protein
MASPALGVQTCTLNVNLFSGARTALPDNANAVLTVRNGNQDNVQLPNNGFVSNAQISVKGLPFFDNFGDNYAVVASASGYEQAGFFPVLVSPELPAAVDIMPLGRSAGFNFHNASWGNLKQNYPAYAALLAAGAADDNEAGNRYSDLMERVPKSWHATSTW